METLEEPQESAVGVVQGIGSCALRADLASIAGSNYDHWPAYEALIQKGVLSRADRHTGTRQLICARTGCLGNAHIGVGATEPLAVNLPDLPAEATA